MIETLEQGFTLALILTAFALYLWLVFIVSSWLWRKLITLVDARIYHPEKPITNRVIISMWEAAKETPTMFFAPAILCGNWIKQLMVSYLSAVDKLVLESKRKNKE